MKRFRALIALSLSLALVVLSPGSSAYHAAAQTMGAASSAAGATGVSGVSGVSGAAVNSAIPRLSMPAMGVSALGLSSSLNAPSIAPSLQNVSAIPAASVSPIVANAAVPAALTAVTPAAAKAAALTGVQASVKTATERYREEVSLPHAVEKGPETMSAEQRKQFDGATLKTDLSVPAVQATGGEEKSVRAALTKKGGKSMPDPGVDENGNPTPDGPIDDLGNPSRRGGEGGPDDRSDPDQNDRGGNGGLFGMFGVGLLGGGAAAVAGLTFGTMALFPMILLSLVLHEIGHARMADKLGDPTARLQNRASFNPLHWKTHIDPVWTLLIPAATFLFAGMIFGGARPVPVETRYFKNPVKDMALVALAGPAVNMGLAAAGALAVTGAVAAGLGAGVIAALGMFVFLNVLLAIFNLIPLPPLDGSHMLKAFLPAAARDAMDGVMDRLGPMGVLVPMLLIFMVAGGAIAGAAMLLAKLMIGGVMAVTGVQMAVSFLPAVAALGLAVGQLGAGKAAEQAQQAPAPSIPGGGSVASGGSAPVDLIVMFGEKKTKLHDSHITNVDVNLPNGVDQYTRLQQAMLAQLETAGLGSDALEPYKGTPLATYARINAATIRVDSASAAEFTKQMTERGFTVHANAERRIIRPVPVTPEQMDPVVRGAVTMDENLKITKADSVHAIAERRWGKPELGFWSGLMAKVFKSEPPQPKFGVIDSGADLSHPLLKRVKEVKNMTSGENVDDIGHGSWVHSTVLHMAPWSRNTTHYKTFLNGGATLDDILKSLTQAGNDGNLVISNSWGDDEGDPNGPDAQLVKKLAQEGHIMVFAAGNAGSGKNTIGAPAIVTYKDPATGAIRVMSVAAAGRDKRIAYFSSRGPGSPKTSTDPSYKDQRPDLTAVGYNIEGAWPAALNDADRVDGDKGPVKAISGTSMSTPGVAGALALLAMMFGVTEKGAKLDAIVNAVMSTLENTNQGVDNEGQGFLNVDAAYKKLLARFSAVPADVAAPHVVRWRQLQSQYEIITNMIDPMLDYQMGTMSDSVYDGLVAELDEVNTEMARIKAEHSNVEFETAGWFARLWMRDEGADVASYRGLKHRLSELDSYIAMSGSWRYGVMIESGAFTRALQERKSVSVTIAAMEKADHTLAYRAAGPIKRLILNATGAAPKP